jgi:hypothetical protein
MEKPSGLSEIEFERAKRLGHYNQGHDAEAPDRGPDHPVSAAARQTRAEMRKRGYSHEHPDTVTAVRDAIRGVEEGEHPDDAAYRVTEKHGKKRGDLPGRTGARTQPVVTGIGAPSARVADPSGMQSGSEPQRGPEDHEEGND